MKDLDKKQLILNELKWMAIYLGTASVIIILLPSPADLVLTLMVFLVLGWYRRFLLLRKLGVKNPKRTATGFEFKKIKELYKSNISDSIDHDQRQVRYYCMKCGNEHREIACPKCGSKMKRAGL
jgi:predicted RNA-binding Zn-ribbon protein involved in translation (DUF1610 family)